MSIIVKSWISSMVIAALHEPRRCTNRRSSVASREICHEHCPRQCLRTSACCRVYERDLGAAHSLHERHAQSVSAMAMTSPVAFICVPRVALCVDELIERPLRELDHHIVERGLEACVGLAGYGVDDLVECIADGDLRRDLCDRIAGRLGGQCGGTGNTRVDLDDGVLKARRVQRELAVAAALYARARR